MNSNQPKPLPKLKQKGNTSSYGEKTQWEVLCAIMEWVGLFANTNSDINYDKTLKQIKDEFGKFCPSTNTMCQWYIHYQQYGEIPEETKKRTQKRKRTTPEAETATTFTTQQLSFLKIIVDDSPHLNLDPISERYHQNFLDDSKSDCSIWNALTKRMNYRLKVYREIALQWCKQERAKFDYALKLIVRNPNQVILINEMVKDKNAGHRRRIWRLWGNKAEWKSVFAAKDNKDFSMIGAANVYDFIPEACELVFKGNNGSDSHPTCGNIDGQRYKEYVKEKLCPMLGDFSKGEPNSIVIKDNVSIHMHEDVEKLINKKKEQCFLIRHVIVPIKIQL